jgi:hypothetical protein
MSHTSPVLQELEELHRYMSRRAMWVRIICSVLAGCIVGGGLYVITHYLHSLM